VTTTMPSLRCFDLDGCVVVSDAAIADGLAHGLRTIGLTSPDAEGLRAAIGPPLITTISGLVRASGVDPAAPDGSAMVAAAVAAYRTRYAEVGFGLTRPVPGIVELLDRVSGSGRGGSTVIVTAKPTTVAEQLLAVLGLRSAFDAVYGAPMGPNVEEKRVTLARALSEADVAPDAAVMIGDRSHDVRAGRACGTRTIGVLWGAGDRAELEQAGADLVVERPDELDRILIAS
jgi:phosphoglycolate phosphatase